MTAENWLRGKFQGIGTQIELNVLESAALSPLLAKPRAFEEVTLSDDVRGYLADEGRMNGLLYALSSLYYSMSAAITGGTKSEKRGNRSISIGGYPLTTADREAFRKEANRIRRLLGCEEEESVAENIGVYDASKYRRRP